MNENELIDAKNRGIKAEQLLKDPLINNAFNDIRHILYKKIESSDFNEREEREDCYRMLRAAEMFEGMFKRHINTGRSAEEKLSTLDKIIRRVQEL